jgi:hypothetical protein
MATTLLDPSRGTDRATPPKEDTTLPPTGPQADRRSSAERNPLRAHNRDRLAATEVDPVARLNPRNSGVTPALNTRARPRPVRCDLP